MRASPGHALIDPRNKTSNISCCGLTKIPPDLPSSRHACDWSAQECMHIPVIAIDVIMQQCSARDWTITLNCATRLHHDAGGGEEVEAASGQSILRHPQGRRRTVAQINHVRNGNTMSSEGMSSPPVHHHLGGQRRCHPILVIGVYDHVVTSKALEMPIDDALVPSNALTGSPVGTIGI